MISEAVERIILHKDRQPLITEGRNVLFLGLGGIGGDVVSEIRKLLEKGTISHNVKFLIADSDTYDLNKHDDNGFKREELINLADGFSPEHLSEEKRKIFFDMGGMNFRNSCRGMRFLGKSYAECNYTLYNEIMHFIEYNNPSRTYIHIITGTCGGLGSGAFIAVANILKHIIESNGCDASIHATLLGKECFQNVDMQAENYMTENTVAFFKELDYFMNSSAPYRLNSRYCYGEVVSSPVLKKGHITVISRNLGFSEYEIIKNAASSVLAMYQKGRNGIYDNYMSYHDENSPDIYRAFENAASGSGSFPRRELTCENCFYGITGSQRFTDFIDEFRLYGYRKLAEKICENGLSAESGNINVCAEELFYRVMNKISVDGYRGHLCEELSRRASHTAQSSFNEIDSEIRRNVMNMLAAGNASEIAFRCLYEDLFIRRFEETVFSGRFNEALEFGKSFINGLCELRSLYEKFNKELHMSIEKLENLMAHRSFFMFSQQREEIREAVGKLYDSYLNFEVYYHIQSGIDFCFKEIEEKMLQLTKKLDLLKEISGFIFNINERIEVIAPPDTLYFFENDEQRYRRILKLIDKMCGEIEFPYSMLLDKEDPSLEKLVTEIKNNVDLFINDSCIPILIYASRSEKELTFSEIEGISNGAPGSPEWNKWNRCMDEVTADLLRKYIDYTGHDPIFNADNGFNLFYGIMMSPNHFLFQGMMNNFPNNFTFLDSESCGEIVFIKNIHCVAPKEIPSVFICLERENMFGFLNDCYAYFSNEDGRKYLPDIADLGGNGDEIYEQLEKAVEFGRKMGYIFDEPLLFTGARTGFDEIAGYEYEKEVWQELIREFGKVPDNTDISGFTRLIEGRLNIPRSIRYITCENSILCRDRYGERGGILNLCRMIRADIGITKGIIRAYENFQMTDGADYGT